MVCHVSTGVGCAVAPEELEVSMKFFGGFIALGAELAPYPVGPHWLGDEDVVVWGQDLVNLMLKVVSICPKVLDDAR